MTRIFKKAISDDELQLVQLVVNGDKEAFRKLYEVTYARVFHYVKGMVRGEETAEDVVVQTYTIAWRKMKNFKGEARLTTWLIGIARNVAFKEFRKQRPSARFDDAFTAVDEESCFNHEKKDGAAKLRQIVARLSKKHGEILDLVFFHGLTYPEIADLINIPVNTVKTRVFHAKKALLEEMNRQKMTYNDF